MSGPLYLASRYLRHHWGKTAILVGSITLIVFLPAGLRVLVGQSADALTARADATPLLVGARGSALELALASLYFEGEPPEPTTWAQVDRLGATGLARAIPLHLGFRAREHPIVGTTLAYLDFRGLRVAAGRRMAVLGECLLGAAAARDLGLGPGDSLVSSPETVFDLAGVYPLKMQVVGVLAPAHTPDDRAVFVDMKTAWILQGLGHGHQDLTAPGASRAVLAREGDRVTANASLVQYNEITPENAGSFHFHGDLSGYPISAVVAVPPDEKSRALLRGRFEAPDETQQVLRPRQVIDELLATVFAVQSYVVAAIATVAAGTLATAGLVFLLSARLRRREIDTMVKIGAARSFVAGVLAAEVIVVLLLGAALAAGLTGLASRFGADAIRTFLVS